VISLSLSFFLNVCVCVCVFFFFLVFLPVFTLLEAWNWSKNVCYFYQHLLSDPVSVFGSICLPAWPSNMNNNNNKRIFGKNHQRDFIHSLCTCCLLAVVRYLTSNSTTPNCTLKKIKINCCTFLVS
jgi:hypothetical protein